MQWWYICRFWRWLRCGRHLMETLRVCWEERCKLKQSCSSLWWQWKISFCTDLSSLRWRGSWRCPSRRSPAGQPASSPPPPSPQQQQSLARPPKHMLLIDHHLIWPAAHCPAITRPFNICGQSPLLQEGTGESENNPHPRPGQRKS